MPNDKLAETAVEKATSYGELMMELGEYFFSNPKRFKSAINTVADLLDVHEIEGLRALARDKKIESAGEVEDRFEEICWAKDQATKRQVVRLMLRNL